jgi:RNA polymerase sigma factor (sigma-70 family)
MECNNASLKEYNNLIYCIMHKNKKIINLIGYDDFLQDLYMVYIDCCKKYNDNLNVKFSTYLYNSLEYYTLKFWVDYYNKKDINCKIDDIELNNLQSDIDEEKILNTKINCSNIYNLLINEISNSKIKKKNRANKILELWFKGNSQKEICELIDLKKSQVSLIIKFFKNKINNLISL